MSNIQLSLSILNDKDNQTSTVVTFEDASASWQALHRQFYQTAEKMRAICDRTPSVQINKPISDEDLAAPSFLLQFGQTLEAEYRLWIRRTESSDQEPGLREIASEVIGNTRGMETPITKSSEHIERTETQGLQAALKRTEQILNKYVDLIGTLEGRLALEQQQSRILRAELSARAKQVVTENACLARNCPVRPK